VFVVIECLNWMAQSGRSGAMTYYEAAPAARQSAMKLALDELAYPHLSGAYEGGMWNCHDEAAMPAVDDWVRSHEYAVTHWLWSLANAHRELIYQLTA
jgi:hypothetical protein